MTLTPKYALLMHRPGAVVLGIEHEPGTYTVLVAHGTVFIPELEGPPDRATRFEWRLRRFIPMEDL